MKKIFEEIFEEMFNLPRTFLAWIVFHIAEWLDLRVISNDSSEDIFDSIFEQIEDIDDEEE